MKAIRTALDNAKPQFQKGGKLEKFYFVFEALETFLFVPDHTAPARGVQIRDAIDLKRLMMTVVIAIIPTLLFGIWKEGHMHALAIGADMTLLEKCLIGAQLVIPVVIVAYTAGGLVEVVFAIIRRHPINEGYLVTGMLIAVILPATIPLWQVALAAVFAVLIAKEVFGGTGMNVLNVAMTARAFLYFAYPTDISGSEVWTYLGDSKPVEGYSGATALGIVAENSITGGTMSSVEALNNSWYPGLYSFQSLFVGTIPGSIAETSTLLVLVGAVILIATGAGSWKIIVGVFGGAYAAGLLFNLIGANAYMSLPAHYHLVMGGLAFGAVYMATDPVSAAHTEVGKWIYGILIGVLTIVIRVFNPAYPEGIMLAVLLMNVFAPLIDYYVVGANKKRRLKRATV